MSGRTAVLLDRETVETVETDSVASFRVSRASAMVERFSMIKKFSRITTCLNSST